LAIIAMSMLIIRIAVKSWKKTIIHHVTHDSELLRRHASSESCFSCDSSNCLKPAYHVLKALLLDVDETASSPTR